MGGVELIHYSVGDGRLRTIRQAFTSAATVDPLVKVAAGRSAFRVPDLLALAALLESLDEGDHTVRESVGGTETVKQILPQL